MAEDVVLARFRADLDQVRTEFEAYVKELEKVQKKERETQDATSKTAITAEQAAKKRAGALKIEQAELKRLEAARELAFKPKDIDDFNTKISESKKRIQLLKGETTGFGLSIKNAFAGIAAGIAAAFSIQQIVNFSREAVNAFIEAEENANRLKFAITQVAGEGEAVFEELIAQSNELQGKSIFSDDAIQQSQQALAIFGLTSDRIKELIPRILDFASATKTDLASATDTFVRALEGQTRGLIVAGAKFEDTGTIMGNYEKLLLATAKTSGSMEQATTTLSGQLEQLRNEADNLSEEIGSGLAPAFVRARVVFLDLVKTIAQDIGLLREASNFQNQAGRRRDAIVAEFKGSVDFLVDNGVALDEARQKVNDRLTERLESEIARKIGVAEFATEVALLKEELETLKEYNEQLRARVAEEARQLTAAQLRKVTFEDLNKLLLENQDLQDAVSKDNVKLINDEIAARKKQTLENEKLLAKQLEDLKKLNSGAQKIKPIELEVKLKEGEEFEPPVNEEIPVTLKPRIDSEEFDDGIDKVEEKTLLGWLRMNNEVVDISQKMLSELTDLYSQFADERVRRIEETRDAELESIDESFEKVEDDLERRKISEEEAEKLRQKLEKQRAQAEADAAKKTRDVRRRELAIKKLAALTEIIIDTAKNIASNPVLAGFYIALAAVQSAAIVAAPNPYRRGTKSSKPGLALVGEEGPEQILLPEGAKVVPTRQTKKYEKVFDAIIDDKYEEHVFREHVAPQLKKQERKFRETKEREFAESISRSIILQYKGMSDKKMNDLWERGVVVRNIEELVDGIVSRTKLTPYR